MTFSQVQTKLFRNNWLIVLLLVISNLSLYNRSNSPTYVSSTTVGLSINNTQYQGLLASSTSFAQNTYDQTLSELSLYLSSRFTSVDIQSEVSQAGDLGAKIDTKKPFYEVKSQGAGFVNITYISGSRDEGLRLVQAVNTVYATKIIPEWNRSRPQFFQIVQTDQDKTTPINSVTEVKPPLQNSFLPSIIGLLFGIFLALALPTFSYRNKSNDKKSQNRQKL